jgi:hypothetical protein
MACVQVDFYSCCITRVSEKILFLYYIAKIKTNALLRFGQLVLFCFLVVPWSQSAPSSAKKSSYKKLLTVSINCSLYKNIVIIVSVFRRICYHLHYYLHLHLYINLTLPKSCVFHSSSFIFGLNSTKLGM